VSATADATSSPVPISSRAATAVAVPIPSLAPQALAAAQATGVLPRLALEAAISGLVQPVFVTGAGDGSGRLFLVEKPGAIRIWKDGQLLAEPFLDICDRIRSSGSEQGLLGLAFAPDFARSGYFWVNYIDLSGNTSIARFQAAPGSNTADPGSEFKILDVKQPAPNHNGGMLAFGPDGYLYAGLGDGGGAGDPSGNGQSPATFLGKMLRLDVTSDPSRPYVVPVQNPWVRARLNGRDVLPEVWAIGLRNPWRYSFDRTTGDLWIADVGQNKYEEVDRVEAAAGKTLEGGVDFGWSIMEGMHCFPESAACRKDGLQLPVVEYQHGANGCSITGGYVYRGKLIPGLDGVYLYGDYCSGRIWTLSPAADGRWRSALALESGLGISSFGEDDSGEMYVVDLKGGVYRIAAK